MQGVRHADLNLSPGSARAKGAPRIPILAYLVPASGTEVRQNGGGARQHIRF